MATKVALGLAILFLNPLSSLAHINPLHLKRSPHDRVLRARQPSSGLLPSPTVSTSPSVSAMVASSASASTSATPAPALASGSGSTTPPSTLTATDPNIPPLSAIVSGMPSQAPPPFSYTFAPGATPPVSGAPPLPTTTLDRSKYPVPTAVAPTDSPLVQQWLKELDGVEIPDIPLTTDQALCSSNPEAAADSTRCWWTCGGCTRSTDIVTCPNKLDWGLSFDDGPSPYTPSLLNYLQLHQIDTTFFVVGSSAYWFPDTLKAEYMSGHHLAVHTWYHQHLTTLTNEEIVAELGYTREIIKDITGVTPIMFRPPYGDIDDRVRAIAAGMGLKAVIWTRDPNTLAQYDTNDWKIASGGSTGTSSYTQFQSILANATDLPTGFIVLEHDLYQQSVDLAVGYTLPSALTHTPAFNIKSISQCLGLPLSEAYQETQSNKTRTGISSNWPGSYLNGLSSSANSSGSNSSSGGNSTTSQGSGASRLELCAGLLVAGMLAFITTLVA